MHRQSNRGFGLVVAVVTGSIGLVQFYLEGDPTNGFILTSIFFFVTAALFSGLLLPLKLFMFALAMRLVRASNFFVLTLLFYIIILPVSVVARLLGYDPMKLKSNDNSKTYWQTPVRQFNEDTMYDQF